MKKLNLTEATCKALEGKLLETKVKILEENDNTIKVLEAKYMVDEAGKHYSQTAFFEQTYFIYKGYINCISEELIGWC